MADERLVSKAIELLDQYGSRGRMSPDEAIETLASFPPFDTMDDEDLAPIATAALARRGAAVAVPPRGGGRNGAPARHAPTRAAPDAAMLTAPYRFVAIDDRVVPAQEAVSNVGWGCPISGGFSGEVEVEWAFETPMLIGVADEKGVTGPMKLGGDYVLPGATLRGMMRVAMGIVCRSRLTQINAHHRYGVRDFTHPLFKEGQGAGAQKLAWGSVGAGWLRKKPAGEEEKIKGFSDYVLTPCEKKIVRIRALPTAFNGGKPTANGQWHRDWLGFKLDARYKKAGYATGKDKEGKGARDLFDFEDTAKTTNFMRDPLAKPNDPTARDHVVPGGGGGQKGWFVFSNNSPSLREIDAAKLDEQDQLPRQGDQKKREYVFLDRPGATEIRLTQEAFDRFVLINSKPGKTKPKPDGSFAVMAPTLEAGRRIPVFYAGDPAKQEAGDPAQQQDRFDMGLTRLFKLSHKYSVGDVLARQSRHKLDPGKPDMVEALFGYVYDRTDLGVDAEDEIAARKGRVAFGFARLQNKEQAAETGVITTVAMAPRASYAPFYLRGPIKDWTDEAVNGREGDARLAGRKRYFARYPRDKLAKSEENIVATLGQRRGNDSEELQTKLRLLKPRAPSDELVFRGTIRLHNVTAEEVGALLWTLTHGGDPAKRYRHMIGRAKNAGAGQARVKSVKLALTANDKRGEQRLSTNLEPWEETKIDGPERWTSQGGQSLGPFLQAFEDYMKGRDRAWPQADDIHEFLGACDPTKGVELKADFLPTPNDHGKLRRLVKADIRNDPVPVTKANDRLLPAPSAERGETPYRGVK